MKITTTLDSCLSMKKWKKMKTKEPRVVLSQRRARKTQQTRIYLRMKDFGKDNSDRLKKQDIHLK
jgi:hypothetical protein